MQAPSSQSWTCAFPIVTSAYDTFADGVAVDDMNNVVVAGHFFGTATFGSVRGDADKGVTMVSKGGFDSFLQKVREPYNIAELMKLTIS